ncbi:MAG TPA: hypothetical protein VJ783_17515 [Pirellulales bacterium]|nr:hypothetical protein [Pirellulales bacterium]
MDPSPEESVNQAAYRRLRNAIDNDYPQGRFIAIASGKIVADAMSFGELDVTLNQMGFDSPEVLVIQAGVEYPESATIFGLPDA